MAKRKKSRPDPRVGSKQEGAADAPGVEHRGGPVRMLLCIRPSVALGILLVVQVAAMFVQSVPAPHTGGDNAAYISLAHGLATEGAYTDAYLPGDPPHTKYPPVFPGVLAAALLLGVKSWAALKLIPQLFTTLFVVGVFFWVSRRHGAGAGLGVGLLLALAPAMLDASNWILSEPPFLALTFLALVLLDRVGDESVSDSTRRSLVRVSLGLVAVVLAYFTRSAGLPLAVAAIGFLALQQRWRLLAGFSALFGVPALLWSLRGRSAAGSAYVSEFWLLDPYQPDLGEAGVSDLLQRLVDNVWLYGGEFIPAGLTGASGRAAAVLGVVLVGLSAVGWFRRLPLSEGIRGLRSVGLTELFTPLYVGLVLAWPTVWSGERFALPLYPIVLVYAGEAVAALVRRWEPRRVGAALILTGFVLLGPQLDDLRTSAQVGGECRELVRVAGPYGCWSTAVQEFTSLAKWSGENLSPDAVVLNRKPRIFHVMSGGLRGEVFPFTERDGALFEAAESLGATHLLLDRWDLQSARFVLPVLTAESHRFCIENGFQSRDGGLGTGLLRILDPAPVDETSSTPGALTFCSEDPVPGETELGPYVSGEVPLLDSDGSGASP